MRVGRTLALGARRKLRDRRLAGRSRLLALIGADICVLALLALAVLGSLLILTDESLETKPHRVLFQ